MSKLAYFNPHGSRVLQWIDTEAMAYNLPDASMLHQCTDAEWELQHRGEMMVKAGAVVPYADSLPIPPTASQIILGQIAELEASVTDRRIREAVLGIDGGWLNALNDQVTALRVQIK